ncbi:MAG: hypothetical protein ACRCX8_06350 [Sarcina sp.]
MNCRSKKGFVTFPMVCFLSFISIVALIMMTESIENTKLLNRQMLMEEKNEEAKHNIRLALQVMKQEVESDGSITEQEIKAYQKSSSENPFKVNIKFNNSNNYITTSYIDGTGIKYVEYFDYKIQESDFSEVIFLSV